MPEPAATERKMLSTPYTYCRFGTGDPGLVLQFRFFRKPELASYFVVYRFNDKEPIDTSDPSKIVAITRETGYLMPYEKGKVKYRYVVTAVDRFHNESEGKTKKVKL